MPAPRPQARAAEIVRATGTVEVQHGTQGQWTAARSGQELLRGDLVRTYAFSVAQLTFSGGVQWQLSAESQVNLEQAVSSGAASIIVRLERGGAVARWTPDRSRTTGNMVVKTPAGQAAITGTEWSMRVDEDGRTTLVVLQGAVELSNDRGGITVHQNEAGEMRPGQPPSLLRLIAPRDRVQWVASYAAAPARYEAGASAAAQARLAAAATDAAAGRVGKAIDGLELSIRTGEAEAADVLAAADLLLAAGEFGRARAHLESGRLRYAADARFDAMLSRVALFDDRPAESQAAASAAIAKDARSAEGWLALGGWAYAEGDAPTALKAFAKATMLNPLDASGWFGQGTVSTEREELTAGRRFLGRALEINPAGAGFRGELGTLETLANNLRASQREYTRALIDHPDDYVALTGAALLALKQGREADALDGLLRATLLEPRYARAQMYLGVTYYRLRRIDAAIRALDRACELDPRDPLPYMMLTQIYTDDYEAWRAMESGRAAQARMPFLKSLNQLSNTPKGSANLGNARAFFGMEAWAQHLAQESYFPYWSGSHLFLGDRYGDPYAKTSEYFQGLIADPTVFGGSPGRQTLLPRPGRYLTMPFMAARNQFDGFDVTSRTIEPEITLNGYSSTWRPVAYVLNVQAAHVGEGTSVRGTPVGWAGSVGIKLTPSWSAFFVSSSYKNDYIKAGQHFTGVAGRLDAGAQYRRGSSSTLSFKAGMGTHDFSGAASPAEVPATTSGKPKDLQFQHAFSIGARHQIAWGVELARLPVRFGFPYAGRVFFDGSITNRSVVAYAAERLTAGPHFQFDVEMVVTAVNEQGEIRVLDITSRQPFLAGSTPSAPSVRPRPRVGGLVRFGPGRLLRVVYQSTTSPLGASSTLGPVATSGVPLDESFEVQLGDERRARGQLEWQWSARTFTTGFVDHKHFGPITSEQDPYLMGIADYLARQPIAHLRDQLRDVSQLNVASPALLENTVAVTAGSGVWVAGLGLNHVVSRQLTLASQYFWTQSSGRLADGGSTRIPYYPNHAFSAGATWLSPRHVYLSASAIYRSQRTAVNGPSKLGFRNAYFIGAEIFNADWTGMAAASWETANKRWAVEVLTTDLFATAPLYGDARRAAVSLTVKYRR